MFMRRTSLSVIGPKRRTLFLTGALLILLILSTPSPSRGVEGLLVDKIPDGQAFGTVIDVAGGCKTLLKLRPADAFKKGDRLELTHMAGMTPVDIGLFEVESAEGEVIAVNPVSMLVEPRQGMQVIASLHKPGSKERRVQKYISDQSPPPLDVSGAGIEPGKMPECSFDPPGKVKAADKIGGR